MFKISFTIGFTFILFSACFSQTVVEPIPIGIYHNKNVTVIDEQRVSTIPNRFPSETVFTFKLYQVPSKVDAKLIEFSIASGALDPLESFAGAPLGLEIGVYNLNGSLIYKSSSINPVLPKILTIGGKKVYYIQIPLKDKLELESGQYYFSLLCPNRAMQNSDQIQCTVIGSFDTWDFIPDTYLSSVSVRKIGVNPQFPPSIPTKNLPHQSALLDDGIFYVSGGQNWQFRLR